MHNKSK